VRICASAVITSIICETLEFLVFFCFAESFFLQFSIFVEEIQNFRGNITVLLLDVEKVDENIGNVVLCS